MIVAITQARMSSSRLPGKVLKDVNGKALLQIHIDRVARSGKIDRHLIATSKEQEDDEIELYCEQNNILCYRGNHHDVLDRFYQATSEYCEGSIVRLTADCPLIDHEVIDSVISLFLESQADYVSNTLQPTFPDGMDVEVFTLSALRKAWNEASLLSDREHVTPYIWRNSSFKGKDTFTSVNYSAYKDYSAYRLTVDEKEDLQLIQQLTAELGFEQSWLKYVELIEEKKLFTNAKYSRNEGYIKSIRNDNKL